MEWILSASGFRLRQVSVGSPECLADGELGELGEVPQMAADFRFPGFICGISWISESGNAASLGKPENEGS